MARWSDSPSDCCRPASADGAGVADIVAELYFRLRAEYGLKELDKGNVDARCLKKEDAWDCSASGSR